MIGTSTIKMSEWLCRTPYVYAARLNGGAVHIGLVLFKVDCYAFHPFGIIGVNTHLRKHKLRKSGHEGSTFPNNSTGGQRRQGGSKIRATPGGWSWMPRS